MNKTRSVTVWTFFCFWVLASKLQAVLDSETKGIIHRINSSSDYLFILGVSKTASEADQKNALRKIWLKIHPDKVSAAQDKEVCESAFKRLATIKDSYEKTSAGFKASGSAGSTGQSSSGFSSSSSTRQNNGKDNDRNQQKTPFDGFGRTAGDNSSAANNYNSGGNSRYSYTYGQNRQSSTSGSSRSSSDSSSSTGNSQGFYSSTHSNYQEREAEKESARREAGYKNEIRRLNNEVSSLVGYYEKIIEDLKREHAVFLRRYSERVTSLETQYQALMAYKQALFEENQKLKANAIFNWYEWTKNGASSAGYAR